MPLEPPLRLPRIIAHRSRFQQAENCVEALTQLPDFVVGAEIDVRLCADRVPVLMHDSNVYRTTGVDADIAKLPYSDITELRQTGGERVPSLGTYLQAAAERKVDTLLVDIKKPSRTSVRIIQSVLAESALADRCLLMGRSIENVAKIRELGAHYRIGVFGITIDNVDEHLAAAEELDLELLCVKPGNNRYLENRQAVKAIHEARLHAGASAINRRESLHAAVEDECDYILTHSFNRLPAHIRGG